MEYLSYKYERFYIGLGKSGGFYFLKPDNFPRIRVRIARFYMFKQQLGVMVYGLEWHY